MENKSRQKLQLLIDRGVTVPNPESVTIDERVDVDRISPKGTVIHSGCKLLGAGTFIHDGAVLGFEGPAVVDNCIVGPDVELKGGYFSEAVFLERVQFGLGGHVRKGTIMEESSSAAHTVGLKQTILFPYVTLGSLINFCDCFMAGGASRKDHSEVGSSYIHFNYTPNQDKATASLLGDVPHGVMLNSQPIFLGGQGGLVGPCRLNYGTVTAAGTIWRKDELRPGRLLFEGGRRGGNVPYTGGVYTVLKRPVVNNILYIANLIALLAWYRHIRPLFLSKRFPEPMVEGLQATLNKGIDERIKRLGDFANRLERSIALLEKGGEGQGMNLVAQQKEFKRQWPMIEDAIQQDREVEHDEKMRESFQRAISVEIDRSGKEYLAVIHGLSPETAAMGTRWLEMIVEKTSRKMMDLLPAMGG